MLNCIILFKIRSFCFFKIQLMSLSICSRADNRFTTSCLWRWILPKGFFMCVYVWESVYVCMCVCVCVRMYVCLCVCVLLLLAIAAPHILISTLCAYMCVYASACVNLRVCVWNWKESQDNPPFIPISSVVVNKRFRGKRVTDGRTDRQTDGRTDGRTHLIKMCGRIQKQAARTSKTSILMRIYRRSGCKVPKNTFINSFLAI